MGVGALNPPTLMDIMLSDGSGWSELKNEIEFNHPPYESKVLLSGGVGDLNSPNLMDIMLSDGSGWSEPPTLMDIMLSDGSGWSESPNPNVYHVEWYK
jgi:hypothetical protein